MKNANELMNEIEEQCCDCKAWSGTDCTRNPYTQGCLKDEKQVIECNGMLEGCDMIQQAVKDTAKEIYRELNGHGTTYVKKWIKERYGLEVE